MAINDRLAFSSQSAESQKRNSYAQKNECGGLWGVGAGDADYLQHGQICKLRRSGVEVEIGSPNGFSGRRACAVRSRSFKTHTWVAIAGNWALN